MSKVEVSATSSSKELGFFIDFPHDLYRDDKNYVPELFIAQRDLLTPGKHPFHEHSELQTFLARRDGAIVGRIAAIWNNNHNAFNGTHDGFFGFFECVNDIEVAAALVEKAAAWLKSKGATTIIGPVNFSTNETCGLLIEGPDAPPFIMTTYNPPYYKALLEQLGFAKKVDLIAYAFVGNQWEDKPLRVMNAFAERLKRSGITIRPVNLKNFKEEAANIKEVYNSAWDKNLGFVPMTDKEFDYMAKDMKLLVDPDFCLVAEKEGKIIGFALALPDINQVFRKVKRGRLFPWGLLTIIFQKRKINAVRVIALGVLERYRKMGVEACFYGRIMQAYRDKRYQSAEASWILENNELMNRALIQMETIPYKRYRIFEKTL